MTSWSLFKHAIKMLVRNWKDVLRIFLVPTLISVGIVGFAAQRTGVFTMVMEAPIPNTTEPAGFLGTILVSAIIVFLVFIWSVVAWHRYVLNEEPVVGFIPPLRMKRIGAYVLQVILISLLVVLSMIPVMIVLVALMAVMGSAFRTFSFIFEPGLTLFPAWVFLRLSVSLPHVATGKPSMSLLQGWKATSGAFGPVIGLALITVVMQFVAESVAFLLAGPLAVIWTLGAGLILGLIQVSILTTLYGYYVEKRPI
ncbi:hypothetical protein [Tritonibacter horizontis]|uniref:Membrane domain of glycerophosphoryl diester phosphodiesterase n=1 Tax=Tritonibacter horizontis TaxID=1768241 RepID=A0A132C4A9_9RHOB|nr:hypothetical protein [Tritonibacter horizontis]KUP94837.1 hypothetical protein TRIHO_01710 [Tritonibacter horizontis]